MKNKNMEIINNDDFDQLSNDNLALSKDELKAIKRKIGIENQLTFAVMLKYYQIKLTSPNKNDPMVPFIAKHVAKALKMNPPPNFDFDFDDRTSERFRNEIRRTLSFREATDEDANHFINWLITDLLPHMPKEPEMKTLIRKYYQMAKIEPFSEKQQDRYLESAYKQLEVRFFKKIYCYLSLENQELIDILLDDAENEDSSNSKCSKEINLNTLKKGIPGAKLKHVQFARQRYETIQSLRLPDNIMSGLSRKNLVKYYDRIMAYSPSHIKEFECIAKYAMVAIFCHIRSETFADSLADLFIKLVRKIKKSSEMYVNKTVIKEIKRVEGKFNILYRLADVSLMHPKGIIKDTIYPIVGEEKLKELREELSQRGNWYQEQVRTKMRSLYSYGSRTELLDLLALLKFNAHDDEDKALLAAVDFIIKHQGTKEDLYSSADNVPIDHVIPDKWLNFVIEDQTESETQINKLNYEMVVCEEVRRRLIYKGIWIDGAYRYRDPHKDLPLDFEANKIKYYKKLGLPMDPKELIKALKDKMSASLASLNESILSNDKVTISDKKDGHIKISPSLPQNPPENIISLQDEIVRRWGHINLIDAFKEANIRIGFTKHLETVGKYAKLNVNKLVMRLLLSLYAIGSNTGLKRISIANPDANETDLQYVKRRFINPANVRLAIREVVNAVIDIREPAIWGEATTSVACDSKKLESWDQNLMTEWHGRYKGHGIMVYWHVDTNALCIYSQSKTCTSSEVGSMIKGVLQHSTKMDLNAAYVDTHGQSTIGFGIGKLLAFEILPRLKNIHKQKLYTVSSSDKQKYKNLAAILKDGIQWKRIEEHYDEAVKHLVALKTELVDSSVFMKRFGKDNYKHPVYKALCEIGKASKTIFLCKYLQQEELRIEINAGLNIVERLNSVMNFFFYGKLGEISNNDPEEQELSILCLHLLQSCAVYINTLLIQEILSDPQWRNKLTSEDYRALSPLIHSHFNPYGIFLLDLETRLIINKKDSSNGREKTYTSERESQAVI